MKKIFDKATLIVYLQSVKRDDRLDNLGLVIISILSLVFAFDLISQNTYQYSLCFFVSVKVFLFLNTKGKIKAYTNKFNQFYNGEKDV